VVSTGPATVPASPARRRRPSAQRATGAAGTWSAARGHGAVGVRSRIPTAVGAIGLFALSFFSGGSAGAATAPGSGEPRLLTWEEMLPAGETERLEALYREYLEAQRGEDGANPLAIPEGGAGDFMPQLGTFETVLALDGQFVRLPGFVVPLDFSHGSEYREFLLVPYFGACIHTPPPPPNQIVYVAADPAVTVENIWEPVWVVGHLHTQRKDTDTGNTAYTLELARLEAYE
jgi:hypothetical protein